MEITKTPLGLTLIRPKKLNDNRGSFHESYVESVYRINGIPQFVQENTSYSRAGVLRGLHLQEGQGKLVRVLKGAIQDVVVNPNTKEFETYNLEEIDNVQLYIPPGFFHGFLAEKDSIVEYKCTKYYSPKEEYSLVWNDPDLNIPWGIGNPILSDKDKEAPTLKEFKHYYSFGTD